MLELIDTLLSSQDNLIEQLALLKKFKSHRAVKRYMKALNQLNLSPYKRYCIDKYYYDLDVEEVKIPDCFYPKLPLSNGLAFVNQLIGNTNDIREQVQNLKKYKNHDEVIGYVQSVFPYFIDHSPYARYIILSNYYDIPYPEIYPTPQSLHITLDDVWFPKLAKKREKREKKRIRKNLKSLKVGSKIVLCSGPFKGMEGVVLDKNEEAIRVEFILFGQKTDCELDSFTKYKISKNS